MSDLTPRELPVRVAGREDWEQVYRLMAGAFHDPYDEQTQVLEGSVWEPDRALVVQDGDAIVGHAAAFSRELTVPGAVVPAPHVTMVAVAPTHRRRGLLTRMMHHQLVEAYHAGREPLAVLWASEAAIYPRFGYGLAVQGLSLEINAAAVGRLAPAGGMLRAGTPEELQSELAGVYERLRPQRPGWSSRTDPWWRYQLADLPRSRRDATELRAVVHDGAAGVDGYALWRSRGDWGPTGPCGEVTVVAAAAETPEAYASIWNFLLSIDLTRVVRYGFAATDEPLQHLVADLRQLGARTRDMLWVRLLEVGTALAARRYAAPVDVVLEVTDPLIPENSGRWRLIGDPDKASCERTPAPADLSCTVTDLGAVYLGGTPLAALAAAGRVRELRPGALAAAGTAFGWHRPPSAPEVF